MESIIGRDIWHLILLRIDPTKPLKLAKRGVDWHPEFNCIYAPVDESDLLIIAAASPYLYEMVNYHSKIQGSYIGLFKFNTTICNAVYRYVSAMQLIRHDKESASREETKKNFHGKNIYKTQSEEDADMISTYGWGGATIEGDELVIKNLRSDHAILLLHDPKNGYAPFKQYTDNVKDKQLELLYREWALSDDDSDEVEYSFDGGNEVDYMLEDNRVELAEKMYNNNWEGEPPPYNPNGDLLDGDYDLIELNTIDLSDYHSQKALITALTEDGYTQ